MQVIPKCISLWSDAMVSIDRIEALIDESKLFTENAVSTLDSSDSTNKTRKTSVSLRDATSIRFPDKNAVLGGVNLSLTGPGLTMIVGDNGSGKSSLLLTILQELETLTGSVDICPRYSTFAYCGHDSWIINKSVKENILLAKNCRATCASLGSYNLCAEDNLDQDFADKSMPLDANRFDNVIRSCSLEKDISNWPAGLDTIIGEKGINISGGQKQRICLARAAYSRASIWLLDSTFSSLDSIVSNDVFHNCIIPASKESLVILCTHEKELLKYADSVVVLNAGRISFQGTYQQFIERNIVIDVATKGSSETSVTVSPIQSIHKTTNNEAIDMSSKSKEKLASVKQNSLVEFEVLSSGKEWSAYSRYLSAGGHWIAVITAFLSITVYMAGAFGDYQIALWTDGKYSIVKYLILYSSISFITIVINWLRYYMQSTFGFHASQFLHKQLLESILGAKFAFFQTTPTGRITSRFSLDFDTIDFSIPKNISSFIDAALGIVTGKGVVIVSSPINILAVIPLTVAYLHVQSQYRSVSKILKRWDSAAKGPLFSHCRETIAGLEVIRGYGIQQRMLEDHYNLLDESIKIRLNWDAANRWLGIRLDLIGCFIVSAAAFSLLFSMESSSGGVAGLVLSYALKTTQSLSFAIRSLTALETSFTSVERVVDYIDIEQEIYDCDCSASNSKPSLPLHFGTASESSALSRLSVQSGAFDIESITADLEHEVMRGMRITVRYASNLPPALKCISFTVRSGQLVGVCGRSGSGKSTLSMLMARSFTDLEGGQLFLENIDVNNISLAKYRQKVLIFPQDSYIFSGTLREFLNPSNSHSDEELLLVLSELPAHSVLIVIITRKNRLYRRISFIATFSCLCLSLQRCISTKLLIPEEVTYLQERSRSSYSQRQLSAMKQRL